MTTQSFDVARAASSTVTASAANPRRTPRAGVPPIGSGDRILRLGLCRSCGLPCRRADALCMKCYRGQLRTSAELTFEERFWSKVDATGDCWLWTAALNSGGYGAFRSRPAHRVAYELLVGPIQDTLDHLCRNRRCVNPDHLEPVSSVENVMRGESIAARNARKATCQRGHDEWAERKDGNGRWCRACGREDGKRRRGTAR